jgi:hypothetical protein
VTLGDGTTTRQRVAARWRRSRVALGVLVLLVAAGALGVLATGRGTSGALDPGSAEPQGARALAQVLQRQGVEVVRASRVAEAAPAAGAGSTLLVVSPDVLDPDRLADLAATDADLVLVEPDGPVLRALAPALEPAGVVDAAVRPAGCDDVDAAAAGRALAGGPLVRAAPDAGATTVCFPDAGDGSAGSYAVTSAGGRTVRVVGQSAVLSNDRLGDDGNAALSLRALGAHPRLVWLMASPLDTAADAQPTTSDLLPGWVPWAAVQLGVVALLAVLWRARRLGRLVPEPLPVVVRSAETAEGRAALYRSAAARDRAAAVLRAAALRRLGARLGLPATASADQVVTATARAAGRDPVAVRALLLGPAPPDEGALVALADDLDTLMHDSTRKAPVS